MHNITVEHYVFFTLLLKQTFGLDSGFRAMLLNVGELHGVCANETPLEISMDDTSSLGCLATISNGPALDLVFTSCEVVNKL